MGRNKGLDRNGLEISSLENNGVKVEINGMEKARKIKVSGKK